jgi:hypothetical protein
LKTDWNLLLRDYNVDTPSIQVMEEWILLIIW